jgi:hypothetical protein
VEKHAGLLPFLPTPRTGLPAPPLRKIAIELEDGTHAVAGANRVIEIAGQALAPSKAVVREQAKGILRFARERPDAERGAFSLRIAGQENFEAGTTTS